MWARACWEFPRRAVLAVTERPATGAISILIFHRVLPAVDPLFPEEMHAERFDILMRAVAGSFNVLTLGQAIAARNADRLPRRALVITFDDGYADNATIALPILRRHGLRATFFIATGFLDGGRMFNDGVIESVRAARVEDVDLGEFGLGRAAIASAGQRRGVIDTMLKRVKYLPIDERERVVKRLHRLVGGPPLPDDLMMRSDQVALLHRSGMEIGGHTVNHPILCTLSESEAEREMADGRVRLESLIDAPVEVFAYPNGCPGRDYDRRHVVIARRLGFAGAVSTVPATATRSSDRHELPRFTPWDHSPNRWIARLAWERWRRRPT